MKKQIYSGIRDLRWGYNGEGEIIPSKKEDIEIEWNQLKKLTELSITAEEVSLFKE